MTFHVPEEFRVRGGICGSDSSMGNNGAFVIPASTRGRPLRVVASDGMGWEHVSVSMPDRCPTWEDMDFVKNLFWDPEDAVMQLHPPRSMHVNNHPYCLHLWRPIDAFIPLPPEWLVGVKAAGDLSKASPAERASVLAEAVVHLASLDSRNKDRSP